MEEGNSHGKREYRVQLLFDRTYVMATGVLRRSDGIYIVTTDDIIPVYAFKMDRGLMEVLKSDMEAWYE
jgi:hypothetical protein